MNIVRQFLIKLLAGKDVVIINADISPKGEDALFINGKCDYFLHNGRIDDVKIREIEGKVTDGTTTCFELKDGETCG